MDKKKRNIGLYLKVKLQLSSIYERKGVTRPKYKRKLVLIKNPAGLKSSVEEKI